MICIIDSQGVYYEKLAIDLSRIPNTSYGPGVRTIGDLDYYGCVVVRTNTIDEKTYSAIDELRRKGPPKPIGKWYGVANNPSHKQIYNVNSIIPREWLTGDLVDFF